MLPGLPHISPEAQTSAQLALRLCLQPEAAHYYAMSLLSPDCPSTHTLPSWCIIHKLHKRFNLSQADFSKRWCLGDVLAQVSSSDGTALPTLCVHVPTVLRSHQCQPSLLQLAEAAASAAPAL
jgi:hypothetical protein